MKLQFKNLVAFSLLLALASCGQNSATNQDVNQYKVLEIAYQSASLTNNYSASIRGRQDIKIIPRVDGYLTEIAVNEGSKVKKGQTLFVIDQVPYIAQLQAAKANVAVCEAGVATAKLTFESRQNLYAKNIVSQFDLLSAENALKTATAQLEQMKAQELSAQNNLSYTVIKSPSNGIIGKLPYRKGDYVSSTIEDGLTIVADNSEMYVYFSMSERQIQDMILEYENIDTAIARMPEVQLLLSNQTVYNHSGKIESISGVVDNLTGAVSVRASFPNIEGRLLSGGAGSIIMPYVLSKAIIIPQEATFEIQNKTYVYKVVNGLAQSGIVEVDKINDGKQYIVTKGLEIGDVIVAEGAGLVQEDAPIKSKE